MNRPIQCAALVMTVLALALFVADLAASEAAAATDGPEPAAITPCEGLARVGAWAVAAEPSCDRTTIEAPCAGLARVGLWAVAAEPTCYSAHSYRRTGRDQ
jgi:hypothetical protein